MYQNNNCVPLINHLTNTIKVHFLLSSSVLLKEILPTKKVHKSKNKPLLPPNIILLKDKKVVQLRKYMMVQVRFSLVVKQVDHNM